MSDSAQRPDCASNETASNTSKEESKVAYPQPQTQTQSQKGVPQPQPQDAVPQSQTKEAVPQPKAPEAASQPQEPVPPSQNQEAVPQPKAPEAVAQPQEPVPQSQPQEAVPVSQPKEAVPQPTAQDQVPQGQEATPTPQSAPAEAKETKAENGETKVEEESPEAIAAGQPAEVIQSGLKVDKENWEKRQQDLLRIIEDLRTRAKDEKSEESLRAELKVREEQIDLLKTRVSNLETKLEAVLAKPAGKNHEMIDNIKQQHEELLTKARGMIFDKTKVVKNQELQIEALSSQVQSLKDVNNITKDLLDIRNSEIKAMEERLQVMESRFKAEKERYDLVLRRAQTSTNINDDLRKEYETQLAIFKELREKYEQRVQALVAENERLKAAAAGPTA